MKKRLILIKLAVISFILLAPASGILAFSKNDTLNLVIENKEETVSYAEFSQWIEHSPVLTRNINSKSELENIHYCSSDYVLCEMTTTYRNKYTTRKEEIVIISDNKIESFLEDLERRINKDPIDAKFMIEDGKITAFNLSEDGLKLDVEKSTEILLDNMKSEDHANNIILAYETIKPEISSENINSLGINTLIGEGKSNFKGSPKNRIHNIKVATNRFTGILIKPGEEFSFVSILGEVDEEHGYKEELVIKKDKTEPEFGGGICQVSTTAFRAAIYSGLEITARRNHAYPVAYYNPPGMDATIYIPRPDLRFKNNTPGYILIQTKIEGTELTFQFYGTDDGRKIEIEDPKIIERNPDNSMKTVFGQKVYDSAGSILIDNIFKSSYDSPDNYPHPGQEVKLTKKPKDWSSNEWKKYKKANGI